MSILSGNPLIAVAKVLLFLELAREKVVFFEKKWTFVVREVFLGLPPLLIHAIPVVFVGEMAQHLK